MLQARYRKDYDGEFIVVQTEIKAGKKLQHREWIANPIENHYLSPRAAVIGSGISAEKFDIRFLENHRGGLLGKQRLQTYGCQGTWRKIVFDFYVSVSSGDLSEIVEESYNVKTPVYTSTRNCLEFPGEFYLVPYNVNMVSDAALALYVAAFDGHKEIYCVGVDAMDNNNQIHNKTLQQINSVFSAYKTTDFYVINDSNHVPDLWLQNNNVKTMTYKKFISHCDV